MSSRFTIYIALEDCVQLSTTTLIIYFKTINLSRSKHDANIEKKYNLNHNTYVTIYSQLHFQG